MVSINPFSNTNKLDERFEKAKKTLKILMELNDKLSSTLPDKIIDSDPFKKYYDYVDMNDDKIMSGLTLSMDDSKSLNGTF